MHVVARSTLCLSIPSFSAVALTGRMVWRVIMYQCEPFAFVRRSWFLAVVLSTSTLTVSLLYRARTCRHAKFHSLFVPVHQCDRHGFKSHLGDVRLEEYDLKYHYSIETSSSFSPQPVAGPSEDTWPDMFNERRKRSSSSFGSSIAGSSIAGSDWESCTSYSSGSRNSMDSDYHFR